MNIRQVANITFLLSSIIILSSCSHKILNPYYLISVIDYSPLTENGLSVDISKSVPYEYTPLGEITVICNGGDVEKDTIKKYSEKTWIKSAKEYKDRFGKAKGFYSDYIFIAPSVDVGIKLLVNKLQEMCADGIIGIEVKAHPLSYTNKEYFSLRNQWKSYPYIEVYYISGTAIKKKTTKQ